MDRLDTHRFYQNSTTQHENQQIYDMRSGRRWTFHCFFLLASAADKQGAARALSGSGSK